VLLLVLTMVLVAAGGVLLAARVSRSPAAGKAQLRPKTTSTMVSAPPPTTTLPSSPVWRVAWGSAMAWGYGTATNATVRELATVAIGGSAVRVRISNVFGNQPLVIGAATVGLQSTRAGIVAGSLHTIAFNASPNVTVPVRGVVYSDAIPMPVSPMQTMAVSLFVRNTDLMTVHPCCTGATASYLTANGAGNLTGGLTSSGYVASSPWGHLLDAVDVLGSTGQGSIVVVGDSITDGYHTAVRWTDVLQQRIDTLAPDERRAVINEAITANTLTAVQPSDAADGGGPPGVSRLPRDALSQSGVSEVVVFLGTNDLYFGAKPQSVIAGLQQVITMAHQAGVRVIGVTLLPRRPGDEVWSPVQQSYLQQVNNWILTSGSFDSTLDFATAVADVYNGACAPAALLPAYDSGDHLHPDPAGETAMANSINTSSLELPATPNVPPLVAVSLTSGCAGVPGIPSATSSDSVPTTTTTVGH